MGLSHNEGWAGLEPFDRRLGEAGLCPLTSSGISVFQVNMGRLCNMACRHCHADAGPGRTEVMTGETAGECLKVIRRERLQTVDITGGAPELNPSYRGFVEGCREAGARVKTRTNLTVLLKEGFGDLPRFFAENSVEVIASMPYFLKETVERQRGRGAFSSSIEALKLLNSAGYGVEGSPLQLNLVYNPCGAYLPPRQEAVEADFRREMKRRCGVSFTNLFTITNMPVGRFLQFLRESKNLERYMERLCASYNPVAAANVMCREIISVGWDGALYDCDFNQMLGIRCGYGAPAHIRDFDAGMLERRRITTGPHCYGCTAGAGSSCSGAMA
ncbi:MAG: arsenosugar biosynthesis radical SAM protein ArsS [Deltaproteobacteria bacterium]|nr:arsenosugar biosynthesis radical SAM protein ArsS [Deltaproteobacteria bacterium]